MKYFSIKTPGKKHQSSYIYWAAQSEYDAWHLFFNWPSLNGNCNPHRAPMADAIRAYESIGYKCVEFTVTEK